MDERVARRRTRPGVAAADGGGRDVAGAAGGGRLQETDARETGCER
jgi:hypothetical protein